MQSNRLKMSFWVFLVVVVYLLEQGSQLALTPAGEGMDSYYHWAYIIYLSNEGKIPKPGETTMPEAVINLIKVWPAPDQTMGSKYANWAKLSSQEREAFKNDALRPLGLDQYVAPNYESQHPPLYYFLLSQVYPLIRNQNLDIQLSWLAFLSLLLSALALPALYLTFRLYLDPPLALLTLLMVVWFPNLMPFLGRVTNDTLSFALAAWFIYACLRPKHTLGQVILAGGLLILGFFTKTYFLTLIPLYLATAPGLHKENGRTVFSIKNLAAALLITLFGTGALLFFNQFTTGQFLPLTEIRITAQISLIQKIMTVFRIDPVWFFVRGIFRNFLWSGYWSFVSPGILYYIPAVVVLAFLGLKRRIEKTAENGSYTIRKMWPHYLAIAFFLLGMLWHAALFKLSAEITRSTAVSGNEGWYLDVLVGSVFTILIVLAVSKLKKSHILPILGCSVGFMVVWNLTARLVMDMFWTGQVRLVTFMRSVVWQDVLSALFHPESWQNWFSLPGVIQPVAISGGLTLGIALVMSAFLTIRFAGHRTLSAIACVPGNSER